ncbi:MAG: hypothetical protein AB2660_15310 [Candidatus Thiodiazotropha sp.]
MDAIEKKPLGDQSRSEIFPTATEAAKKVGLGNEKTARQATKIVHEGAPELIEAVDKGNVSITAIVEIIGLIAATRNTWIQIHD